MYTIPKKLLNLDYRKELWKRSQEFIKKIEKIIPVSSVYLLGSFTTKKRRLADVDFVFVPDNNHDNFVLEDTRKWMKQKYGSKKSAVIRLK